MARHASNYRQARRAAWKALNKTNPNGPMPWGTFNAKAGYDIGTLPATRGDVTVRNKFGAIVDRHPRQPVQGRSKYMPHIGAKQLAKAAS